ncbi:3-deoxy-manno-octulosonate cytidylyltransferase [Luteimonas sp. e5]
MVDFVVAIPARHAATRLPGKPLQLLAGRPLVWHVAQRALAAGAREVWLAADDERIVEAVAGTPVRVAMTSSAHASGTDRLAECADIAGWDAATLVVNLQGDEPFAPAAGIRAVAELLARSDCEMATLATPINRRDTVFDPNAVKVVADAQERALYFSRAPIPWQRGGFDHGHGELESGSWLRHIGIYAYRAGFLRRFTALPPGRLEQIESLEQLRVLEAGHRIAVGISPEPFPPGVDTPEDLARAERLLRSS